jgi:hypothetical protein
MGGLRAYDELVLLEIIPIESSRSIEPITE